MTLDERERAALHLVGAVDREVKLRLAGEVGERDAERFCLTMGLDGGGDADNVKAIAHAASNLVDDQC